MLRATDLSDIRLERAVSNRAVYKDILGHVHDKILLAARRGLSSTCYYIRPLHPDRPLINTEHAANYVRSKLSRGGFGLDEVSAQGTTLFNISWAPDQPAMLRKLAARARVPAPRPFF